MIDSYNLTFAYQTVRKIKIEHPSIERHRYVKGKSFCYLVSQRIQELLRAFVFKYENAILNGAQEKESIMV